MVDVNARWVLAGIGAARLLSQPQDTGEKTAENINVYPADDDSGYTFETSAGEDETPQWTLTPLEGDVIEFTGERVTMDVPPDQYSVTVTVGDRQYTTTVIIGGG